LETTTQRADLPVGEHQPTAEVIDVRLVELGKSYGEVVAVERVDLEIRRGEFFTVYLAHRLTRDEEGAAAVRGGGAVEAGAVAPA
jgi:hypothetical protein